MSSKNKLQEYCQKNKISLPIYSSNSRGFSNELEWFATVKIIDLHIEASTINSSNSKTIAEQKVADMVLNKLDFETNKLEKIDFNKIKSVVLIDLENKPTFKYNLTSDCLYIGFHNSIHHSLSKYTNWHICTTSNINDEIIKSNSNQLLYLIEGGVPDLVDHFMTMFTYPLIFYLESNNLIQTIYIISGDHAGFCTKACIEKAFEWNKNLNKIPIKNIGSILHIVENIRHHHY